MKIGFYLNSFYIPAWTYEAIKMTLNVDNISPCVFMIDDLEHEDSQAKFSIKSIFSCFKTQSIFDFIYDCYNTFDKKRYLGLYNAQKEDASTLLDIRNLSGFIPIIQFSEHNKNYIKLIEKIKPDIIFQSSDIKMNDHLLSIPKLGIWSYYLGDPNKPSSGPIGFWEAFHKQEVIEAVLLQTHLDNYGLKKVLARIICPTSGIRSPSSIYNSIAWSAAALLSLCVKRCINTGSPNIVPSEAIAFNFKKISTPGPLIILKLFSKILYKKISEKPKLFYQQHWTIHLSQKPLKHKVHSLDKNHFTRIENPKGVYWADPFLIGINGKDYLFFEEYEYNKQKGRLKAAELLDNHTLSQDFVILENRFHLSFPFVFMDNNNLYLLPEQAERNELILYRCLKFPNQWESAYVLLKNKACFDPVLLKKEGKWWLFVTEKLTQYGSGCIYTNLYFSETLAGPWKEHPMNPISTDCRYSRAGGNIFTEKGSLIRVVQDCSKGYGYRIIYMNIKTLSETEYLEEPMALINHQDFDVDGVHTVNFYKNYTVIDSREKTLKVSVF